MNIRTIIVGAVAGLGIAAAAADDEIDTEPPAEAFSFEVAENGTSVAFDEAPVFVDGMPGYGNPFLTEGYIYEAGTLADGGGVNPDGSATHPEAVIGTWICEGTLVGDGARTERGPWVVSTQLFDFGEFDGFHEEGPMGTITYHVAASLDGYIERADGDTAPALGSVRDTTGEPSVFEPRDWITHCEDRAGRRAPSLPVAGVQLLLREGFSRTLERHGVEADDFTLTGHPFAVVNVGGGPVVVAWSAKGSSAAGGLEELIAMGTTHRRDRPGPAEQQAARGIRRPCDSGRG